MSLSTDTLLFGIALLAFGVWTELAGNVGQPFAYAGVVVAAVGFLGALGTTDSETTRTDSETTQTDSETTQTDSETTQTDSATTRTDSETTRTDSATTRTDED